jgi:hypothetical protein
MKISNILTAVNNEELYIDFIPNFIKHWNFLFPEAMVNIILIAQKIPDEYIIFKENIILFNELPNISSAFQAMNIRNLFPALINSSDGVLITDIDMMPMNRKYYEEPIKNIKNNSFVTYRDVLLNNYEFPMCYNIATPYIWSEVFNLKNLDDLKKILTKWYEESNYRIKNPQLKGINDFDQKILYLKLQEFQKRTGNLIILNDKITEYFRLDRLNTDEKTHVWVNKVNKYDIINLKFHDYHSLRPYKKYKKWNDIILNTLLQSKSL